MEEKIQKKIELFRVKKESVIIDFTRSMLWNQTEQN